MFYLVQHDFSDVYVSDFLLVYMNYVASVPRPSPLSVIMCFCIVLCLHVGRTVECDVCKYISCGQGILNIAMQLLHILRLSIPRLNTGQFQKVWVPGVLEFE